MTEVSLIIEGMSCQHCVNRVRKAVEALEGIRHLDVAIGLVRVSFDEGKVSKDAVEKAIAEAGYRVVA